MTHSSAIMINVPLLCRLVVFIMIPVAAITECAIARNAKNSEIALFIVVVLIVFIVPVVFIPKTIKFYKHFSLT